MKTCKSWTRSICLTIALLITHSVLAAEQFVNFDNGDLLLNKNNSVKIYMDGNDQKGVAIAVRNLQSDLQKVCGGEISIVDAAADADIVIGTLGHSAAVDQFAKAKRINAKLLKGKKEMYLISIQNGKVVIAGSDRRGTIFGIYELSRQIGVSPWYYWADVPVVHHDLIFVKNGDFTDGEPAVRYRGLFINDEAPCLTSWVKNTFGTEYGGHDFYAKVFELILRLKGNFLWPAMWGWAFYADDPENGKTADEMGVMIGTSHHEPMGRNHQEWVRHRKEYGAWNYQTNKDVLDRFFREGIERAQGTDDLITIGMRGDGDEAMSAEADTKLLQTIVDNQRRIIQEVTKRPAKETPQVWALYKEVLDYYDKGMTVPDDVLILLCDDNWGNVRRVPNAQERKHPGGWGLYYHVDYVGAPRNSKWLNVTPSQNMWEQLQLAYQNGIDRLWILNVGDIKPMEYPITLFMDMAWNPDAVTADVTASHTTAFCRQLWGTDQAEEASRILNLCCKYNGRVTAEMLNAFTYNVETGDWQRAVNEYMELENAALRQFLTLKEDQRDSYRQLILFPVQAMSNIYQMYYAQAMNHKLFREQNPDANLWADKVEAAFRRDSLLCAQYNHDIANGKWNGMMTQKHIGYVSWNDDFPHDVMPKVFRLENIDGPGHFSFFEKNGYVAMEAEHFWEQQGAGQAQWTVIPYMGRTLSAMSLMPYTTGTDNASLSYRFMLSEKNNQLREVKVYVVVKSTLDYLNKGGLEYTVSIDGGEAQTVNFNSELNEKPENIYSKYYPTVALRVVPSMVQLPLGTSNGGWHTLTLHPKDPGIVFEKVVVDCGGYQPSFLFMEESPKTKN
jgi:hypothetical protein